MAPQIKAAHYQPKDTQDETRGLSLLLPLDGRNGFVFLVVETTKLHRESNSLYQVLHEQTERLVTSFGKDANPQHRFEQFLGSLNELLAQEVREGHWSIPIEQFHAIVGIASEEQMYLSGTGELTALFFHKQPSERFQILNLSRSIQTEQTLPTWEKAFAVILDGDLHEGDVFCICNKELQREMPPDELNALLTTLPPNSSIEKVRQCFSVKDSFLMLVLKVAEKLVSMQEGYAKPLSDVSIDDMIDYEKETAMLLEDRKPNIRRMAIRLFEKLIERKMASRLLKDLSKTQPNTKKALFTAQQWFRIVLKQGKRIVEKNLGMIRGLTKKETRKHILKNATTASRTATRNVASLRDKIMDVPRSTTYLIGGVVVAVIVLTVSVSWLSKSLAKSEQEKQYQEKLANIEDVMERAAGAVIYKDENQARSLYVNASTLVDALPKETETHIAQVNNLNAEIETAMNELRHLVTIPNPALLGDLAALSDGLFGNALIKAGSSVYIFASDNRVYELDRSVSSFKPAATQSTLTTPVLAASADDGNIYALAHDSIVQFFPETQTQTAVEMSERKQWVDVMAYANRLYLLEAKEQGEGQLYRFARSGNGFGSPTKWIEAKTTELDQAVSLTIDGSVYVLKKNGVILKYINGTEVGWKTGVVDPPLTGASDLWTDADSLYLYVLEPTTKRIVIFNKESGAFVVQYRSDAFKDLTDFLVDEKDYSIYMLTGSKLYSIAASHLK